MTTLVSELQLQAEPGIYSHYRYIQRWQHAYWWLGAFVAALMGRHQVIELREADLEPGMKYVLAINHQTYLDSLAVSGRIPYPTWNKIGTPRALAANRFFSYPVVGFILRSVGCFPAREHPTDPYGLPYAMQLMERGHSIMIFPEGRVTLHRQNPAKRGVMVLAQQPNTRVIPVHLEWRRRGLLSNFDIGIGKPFDASQMSAQDILDRVYEQPCR